jgi:two-component system sensor histidine kinase KdpD
MRLFGAETQNLAAKGSDPLKIGLSSEDASQHSAVSDIRTAEAANEVDWRATDASTTRAALTLRGAAPQRRAFNPWPSRARYLVPIAYVIGGTVILYLLRDHLQTTEAALVYLLLVVLAATTAGAGPAVAAALLGFVVWNYFFIGPPLSFAVDKPHDWITLAVFLIVAMLTGELAGRAREHAAETEARLREISILHRIGAAVAEEREPTRVLPALLDQASALCGGAPVSLIPSGSDVAAEQPGGYVIPLEVDGHRIGSLRLDLDPATVTRNEARVLATLAGYAAIAMERRRLVDEAAAVAALRAADELKTALLSAVSHGLKTPLASMLASLANLRRRGVGASGGNETLAQIESETQRLATLVDDLLDLSRLESGAWHPAREWNDLGDILGAVLGRLDDASAARVRLSIPDDLPMVRVDAPQVAHVLANLLDNAAKYALPRTPIQVAADVSDGVLRVSVADEGPGVPPEERESIFQPFYRAGRPADASVTGTGLGLAICRGLVEAHGGAIWVESAGAGTAFVFTLPLEQDAAVK